jgi:hypothetical protein
MSGSHRVSLASLPSSSPDEAFPSDEIDLTEQDGTEQDSGQDPTAAFVVEWQLR